MTLGWGFIGKEIKGKIYYSDYDWLFLVDLNTEKNIKYYAKKLERMWFNKKSLSNKKWGWKVAPNRKEYKKDEADYHLLIKGDKILISMRGNNFTHQKPRKKIKNKK